MSIETVSLYKEYSNGGQITRVLKNLNVHLGKGEFVAITGPSGSGKTTLMNIIGCLDRPTSGLCLVEGRDTSRMKDGELACLRNTCIGFVFQSFNLLPQFTALENVELPLLYGRTSGRESRRLARMALERLGLGERLRYFPAQLSGGQKQRVAIARAIVTSPSIILADEPTGSLDSATGREVMNILLDLNREGHTVVVVTHDREIASAARRAIHIRDGQIKEHMDENKRKPAERQQIIVSQ